MLLEIPALLSARELAEVRSILDQADWKDGKITAGFQSAKAKNNRQLADNTPAANAAGDIILKALGRNPLFISSVLPLRVFPPLFNSYTGGENFGTHVDNAIRTVAGTQIKVRTDVSTTVFLSDPADYDGGELVIEDTFGSKSVKLAAGHAIVYPGTSLHHITPVTRGERRASFFWSQSMVKDDGRRSLLFDLDSSIQWMSKDHPEHPSLVQMTGVYNNLLRQWAEL